MREMSATHRSVTSPLLCQKVRSDGQQRVTPLCMRKNTARVKQMKGDGREHARVKSVGRMEGEGGMLQEKLFLAVTRRLVRRHALK